MKKSILTLALLLVTSLTFASNSELFKLDINQVKEEFSQLDALAQKVKAENISYSDLLATDAMTVNSLALSNTAALPAMSDGGPLGIPSFLWGCVLGIPGVAITYFVTDDNEETKKALWGCLAGTAAFTILYFAVFATAAASY